MPHQGVHPSEVIGAVRKPDPDVPSPSETQSLVRRQIEEALNWREQHLDPIQSDATDYYRGDEYGNEEEGRSQVVTTEVQEAVQEVMPSLIRVFFGSERVVEFKPHGPEDVAEAKQQTEYINYIVSEDNEGFLTFHSAFKDALIRKMGVVKWWWDEKTKVTGYESTGLTAEQVAALRLEPGVEVELLSATEEELMEGRSEVFDVEIRRRVSDGRAKLAAVPPEEWIFTPNARSVDDALMVGHVRDVPADELVAMGIPRETVDKHKGSERDTYRDGSLRSSRRLDAGVYKDDEQEQLDATRPVRFAEVYTRLDLDGDGIAELRKIEALGHSAEIVNGDGRGEIVDMAPFAVFEVDPEPHTLVGLSLADKTMDNQRISSHVTRGMLDSLTQTLHPATEVVESEVNMKDVLNQEMGRVIRARKPGMMREITTPFVGKEALPVLQYLEKKRRDQTGISKAAAGLDADALQSSTQAAVSATVEAAQARVELIARMLAETGMKRLMKGLLRLVAQHQDEPRVVRLRNEFVRVDPRNWHADKDVVVNVALGTGLAEEKLQMLAMIAEKQEQLLANGAPIVSFSQYRNTLARMTELAGFRNSNEFFQPFGPEDDAKLAQQKAQQAQEPSTEEQLVQIEAAKVKQKTQEKMAEMRLKVAELALEREKVARELALDEAELDMKGQKDMTDAAIERARTEIEAATKGVEALKKMSETQVGGGNE